jgi:hypothetical protein
LHEAKSTPPKIGTLNKIVTLNKAGNQIKAVNQVHTSNNAVGLAIYRMAPAPLQLDTKPDR